MQGRAHMRSDLEAGNGRQMKGVPIDLTQPLRLS
jgi:hypothetical protein